MKMKEEQKIIYTNWAVANVFKDGLIELHKDLQLPEYRNLKREILDHEREHDFDKGFLYNLKVDFLNSVRAKGILQFMLRRPKTWIQLFPVYWTKSRGLIYDKSMMLLYLILAAGIFTIIKFIGG